MELSGNHRRLIAAIGEGLPLTARPYRDLGRAVGLGEEEVIALLEAWLEAGAISRLGVIVNHRELGYCANAMVVWDVADAEVDAVGRRFSGFDFVGLCYRRPRRPPEWPYNLFCMIHGRERAAVLVQVGEMARACGVADVPHEVLFSERQFRQRGARYGAEAPVPRAVP